MSYHGQVEAEMKANLELKIGRLAFLLRKDHNKPQKTVYDLIENETGWNKKQIEAVIEGREATLKGYLDACLDEIETSIKNKNSVMRVSGKGRLS